MMSDEQIVAPTLAELARMIIDRPLWQIEEPLEVAPQTFQAARAEMASIQEARGFPVATANIKRINFLLRGVPIVIEDDA